jgi:hypothetical protein
MSENNNIAFKEIYFAVNEREVSSNNAMVIYINSSTQYGHLELSRVKCNKSKISKIRHEKSKAPISEISENKNNKS